MVCFCFVGWWVLFGSWVLAVEGVLFVGWLAGMFGLYIWRGVSFWIAATPNRPTALEGFVHRCGFDA